MSININKIFNLLKEQFRLFLSISFGVFLFILFFQPFPIDIFDTNNMLIFVAGLGGIVFLFMVVIRVVFFQLQAYSEKNQNAVLTYNTSLFLLFIFCSVAFTFYIRYVGLIDITFYIVFKILIICLIPPIILFLHDLFNTQKLKNKELEQRNKSLHQQIAEKEEDFFSQTIEFVSDYKSENLMLPISDIIVIRSANNYVEIIYKEGFEFRKTLIRNTLKNIEQRIRMYSNFIRCHRICIVNTYYIDNLNKSSNNYFLTLREYPEKIPVSRQYLLKIKENFRV